MSLVRAQFGEPKGLDFSTSFFILCKVYNQWRQLNTHCLLRKRLLISPLANVSRCHCCLAMQVIFASLIFEPSSGSQEKSKSFDLLFFYLIRRISMASRISVYFPSDWFHTTLRVDSIPQVNCGFHTADKLRIPYTPLAWILKSSGE